MNTHIAKLILATQFKIVSCIIGILLFNVLNELIFAAPPSRRHANAERTSSDTKNDRSNKAQSFPKANAVTKQRTKEFNNGALPESEVFSYDWDERANNIENWLDKSTSEELCTSTLETARQRYKNWPDFGTIDKDKADELGIRVIESPKGQVILYTDLQEEESVDEIANVLEEAIPKVLEFFDLDDSYYQENRRIEAFLMSNVNSFITIGALDGPPRFLYGYSMGNRIYAKDQRVEYYNRFLLIHELVHTLMHEVFGDLRPRWFSEGTAEYVALHKWEAKTNFLELAVMPESEEMSPGFGRLQQVQQLVKANEIPTLREIINFEPQDFINVSTYSWSWALTVFFNRTPKYQEIIKIMPYWSIAEDPNRLFIEAIGDNWNELENDWADFIDRIDYSYDFKASEISEVDRVENLDTDGDEGDVTVSSVRGWQKTGLFLKAGYAYKMTASGRYKLYLHEHRNSLDFEAPGGTFEYFHGKPIGRLEAVVVPPIKKLDYYQSYGMSREESNEESYNGEDFHFNAFANQSGRARRVYEIDGVDLQKDNDSQDSDDSNEKELEENMVKDDQNEEREVKSPFFDPLFPWSEAIGFNNASQVLKPRYSGELYMRINVIPSLIQHNKGSVKVRVKKQQTSTNE